MICYIFWLVVTGLPGLFYQGEIKALHLLTEKLARNGEAAQRVLLEALPPDELPDRLRQTYVHAWPKEDGLEKKSKHRSCAHGFPFPAKSGFALCLQGEGPSFWDHAPSGLALVWLSFREIVSASALKCELMADPCTSTQLAITGCCLFVRPG